MSHAAADQSADAPVRPAVQFSITDLLLLFAALGPTLGLVGTLWSGVWTEYRVHFLWFCSLIAWVAVYVRGLFAGDRRFVWSRIAAAGVFVVACVTPQLAQCGRDGPRRSGCTNNLKNIVLALHNYHAIHGRFPPAFLADAQGRPTHSWRVLILPYLDEKPLHDLYDFNEPWDGPNNSKLLTMMPDVYRCPSDDQPLPATLTSYVAIVGPDTAWPGATSARFSKITDGPAHTLLVVESHDAAIPWMQPADLEFPPLVPRINPQPGPGISSSHRGGAQAALADGSVRFMPDDLPAEQVRALLTIAGGEEAQLD